MYQGHLIDDHQFFIMKLPEKIVKLDLSDVSNGKITRPCRYNMEQNNYRFFHSHIDEESRSLYVNTVEGYRGNINAILELNLDTLELKRKIGPGIQGQYFYFAEKYKKIFGKISD